MNSTQTLLNESKVFCAKAFSSLSITPSGACNPCCLFEQAIEDSNGKPLKVWENDLKEIYNSDFMQQVRQKMLTGESIDACRQCYQVESHGGESLRTQANRTETYALPEIISFDDEFVPVILDLKLNNRCNLKCRMCQPRDSNLIFNEFEKVIAKDPQFSRYSNASLLDPDLQIQLSEIPDWSNSDAFFQKLEAILPHVRKIAIVGGEPLLLDEVYRLIDLCVEKNYAKNIFLAFTTNLMHLPIEKLKNRLSKFRRVLFNISLDATGDELNYIRFPSKMDKVVENFKTLYEHKSPGVAFQFTPTVQVYNVLYLDSVYYFAERLLEEGYELTSIAINLMFLEFPVQLNIRILPESVRREAIAKLQLVLITTPKLMQRPIVRSNLVQLISILKDEKIAYDYIPEFLYYSDRIDQERNQDGRKALPELFQHFEGIVASPPPETYHSIRERGWELAKAGKLEQALLQFELAILTSENKDMDYREMAWMKLSLGKKSEAYKYYQAAYRINPSDPYVLRGLALLYSEFKEYNALRNVLPQAISANPDDGELKALMSLLEN